MRGLIACSCASSSSRYHDCYKDPLNDKDRIENDPSLIELIMNDQTSLHR